MGKGKQLTRAQAIALASDSSLGRFPGVGAAQNDTYVYPDTVDATHPFNFDYLLPQNFQRLVSARLSFKIRPYRTYSSLSLSSTGAGTAHNHSGESGHSHSHAHTIPIATGGPAGGNLTAPGGGAQLQVQGGIFNTAPINADGTGSSGHGHSDESAHTHSVSGTTTLGVAEDTAPVNPGLTVAVDGVDKTALLGGPFNADQVEIDVTRILGIAVHAWHTLTLQPNQRCRITGILRVSYYVDSRLSQ